MISRKSSRRLRRRPIRYGSYSIFGVSGHYSISRLQYPLQAAKAAKEAEQKVEKAKKDAEKVCDLLISD